MSLPLSVGATRGQKVLVTLFALFATGILCAAAAVAAFVLGLIGSERSQFGWFTYAPMGDECVPELGCPQFDDSGMLTGFAPPVWTLVIAGFIVLVFLAIVAIFFTTIMATFRHRAELDGTVLRGAGRAPPLTSCATWQRTLLHD